MPIQNNLPVEALLTDVADFSPVLPDSVAQLLLNRAGLDTSGDPRIARIAALSAQKFVTDILLDAWQCARNRQNKENRNTGSKSKEPKKNVLTMDDLQQATSKIGITLRKPPYYH